MRFFLQLFFATLFLGLLLAIAPQTTDAQFVCPAELGCPEIILSPETMVGDFYLNEQLLAGAQNRPILQLPPGESFTITLRNIQNPGEAGMNELFIYEETTVNVNVRAGQVRSYNVYPRKQYIRGTLEHTCDPRSIKEGEDVSCQVLIDGADRGVYPAGQEAAFILDPGSHTVAVQLVGGSAGLWSPTFKEQTTTITAGRTANLRTRFDKRAHLIVTLNEVGVVGDFYVNEVFIAGQVASIDIFVNANERQNIAVRNVQPPTSGYRWLESTGSANIGAGQERTVTIRLNKEPLVSGQQSAALDSMQRTLDRGREAWNIIGLQVWRALESGQSVSCGLRPASPSLPSVNQSVLNADPAYQAAYDVLTNAINEVRTAIDTWRTECSFNRDYVDPNLYNTGIASTNNADVLLNDAQNRITALRNPPQ